MNTIDLPGCSPEPLLGYLKALGVFRLVAEQKDPTTRLSWPAGRCRLTTALDRDALLAFFRDEYRPTPIVAPWNGGSGFYPGGSKPLTDIEGSVSDRLEPYRAVIEAARKLLPKPKEEGKPLEKPTPEQKQALLARCRAGLPDAVVPWLDVCFVLGEDGPSYFSLLGTGGNDGRLDFTNNFFQRLSDVLPFGEPVPKAVEESGEWLSAALFLDALPQLTQAAIGQFNPGGVGGANGVQGRFDANSRANPWDFVLMVEGALLFAGTAARRLGTTGGARATFPFTVDSVAVGYGSATASEETSDGSRAEVWLPLWDRPAAVAEVANLFGEGRAQVGRRQAGNAVEFALAASLLGVSRGVTAFSRYGFLKRNGLAFLAAPLGRVRVTHRPDARLLDDPPFTDWLDRLRRACRDKDRTPARYQAALRGVDRAMFEFASRSQSDPKSDPRALADVLAAAGRAERALAAGDRFTEGARIRPLQNLDPQWVDRADDDSREFRLAASLAGVTAAGDVGPLRAFVEPVKENRYGYEWDYQSTSAVWSNVPLAANLAAVFRRRQLEAFRSGEAGVPLRCDRPAPLADVLAFLNNETDDDRLADLLWALAAVKWQSVRRKRQERPVGRVAVPFEFAAPRLLVSAVPVAVEGGRWRCSKGADATVPDPDVFHALGTGRADAVTECADRAARRLRSGGRAVRGYRFRARAGHPLGVVSTLPADRLLAAMLFPLSRRDLSVVADAVLSPPDAADTPSGE